MLHIDDSATGDAGISIYLYLRTRKQKELEEARRFGIFLKCIYLRNKNVRSEKEIGKKM